MPPPPLTPSAASALYQRLLAGDPTAPSDLAITLLDYLGSWLIRYHPQEEESLCWEAAEDAIIALAKDPVTYDPARSSLDAYLRMSSQRDLDNLTRSARRRSGREVDWGSVELSPQMGKYLEDRDADPASMVDLQEAIVERLEGERKILGLVQDGLSVEERNVLQLMRIKERKTERYAAVLGITQLSPAQQQAEVKRVKDRLTKRMERAGAFDD
jgi:RNA polymerase sigma-70 factor (ECF subfamily)